MWKLRWIWYQLHTIYRKFTEWWEKKQGLNGKISLLWESLGISLIEQETEGIKEGELEDLKKALKVALFAMERMDARDFDKFKKSGTFLEYKALLDKYKIKKLWKPWILSLIFKFL